MFTSIAGSASEMVRTSRGAGPSLAVVRVLSGCAKPNQNVVVESQLGTFFVKQAGASVESGFHIPRTAVRSTLGFAVYDLAHDDDRMGNTLRNLSSGKLRLGLHLATGNSTDEV